MQYKIVNSVASLPNFSKELPVFSDIETDGLYGPLRMIQLYQPQTDPNIYICDIAPIGYDKDMWAKELINVEDLVMSLHTVWYNGSYDLGTLNISPSMGAKHPEDITSESTYVHRVDDLFYAVKSAYPEFMEFGLKKIVKKLAYTKGLYEGNNTKENAKGFVRGAYISAQAYEYAALDVKALAFMWEDKKIQAIIQNNLSYIVDMKSQSYALIYQQNGLQLDRKMWIEKLNYAERQVAELEKYFPVGFKPNSYKQVRAYFDITESDHEALVAYSLSDNHKAKDAERLIDLKKYMKQVSYLKSINFDRMYTKFNAAGAISGRFTSSGGDLVDGFNSQQIPKDFQGLFTSELNGTKVVDLDYSTLELRLACAIYGVSYMYKQFQEDRDLHIDMASVISGKSLAPDSLREELDLDDKNLIKWGKESDEYITYKERRDAKAPNFGFVFGMSADKFVTYAFTNYGVKFTFDESKHIRKRYFTLYPELATSHDYVWSNYKKPGFVVTTALGRRVKPKLGTDGINIPVQGSGAETTKLGVNYMVKENPLCLKYIFNVVHDAVYKRVPAEDFDYWEDFTRKNMIKGWTEISKTRLFKYKDIPMKVE